MLGFRVRFQGVSCLGFRVQVLLSRVWAECMGIGIRPLQVIKCGLVGRV